MKIGFDISQTGKNKAGCGYFADSLARTLVAGARGIDWVFYSSFGPDFWDPDHRRSTTKIPDVERRLEFPTHGEAIAFWQSPAQDFEIRLGSPDIIHANNFYCPSNLKQARLVYTLHDLAFFVYPDLTTEANRLICSQGVFNASLYADLILANSSYTRSHFLTYYPHFPEDRIHVVYPASRFAGEKGEAVPVRGLESRAFWLSVGTLEPRKNWRFLLEAYAKLRRNGHTERKLVMTGGGGWLEDDLPGYIQELGIREDVILTGYVSDEKLRWLYGNCFAFVYPSLFEGFGMPVLEAMSLGAPIITSEVSSLPEVVGDVGILVDPLRLETLVDGMMQMEREVDFAEVCRTRSKKRAQAFSWETSAAQVLSLYEILAG